MTAVAIQSYSLDVVQGRIVVTGSQAIVEELATVNGAQSTGKAYTSLPPTVEAVLAAEAIAIPNCVSPAYRQLRAAIMAPDLSCMVYADAVLKAHNVDPSILLPHQLGMVVKSLWRAGVLDGSDRGTGKTRSAIASMIAWGSRRAVIVCTKSVIGEWPAEAKVFGESLFSRFLRLDDAGPGPRGGARETTVLQKRTLILEAVKSHNPTILVLNYEVLGSLLRQLQIFAPDFVIFDESWKLKSGKAAVTKAAARLTAETLAHNGQVLELTGTAIGNHVGDLHSQLKMVGAEVAENYDQFMTEHARIVNIRSGEGRIFQKVTGVRRLPALMATMEPVWFRACKDVCLTLPPPRPHTTIEFDMDPDVRDLYDRVAEFGEAVLGDPLSLAGERVVAMRLAQIAGGHRPDLSPQDEEQESSARSRKKLDPLPCAKLRWLEDKARDEWSGNPAYRVLIWCKHNAEVHRIANSLSQILGKGRAAAIDGPVKNSNVDRLKAEFNSRREEGPQVLVCQIWKMAFGHNLQAGDHSIYYSHTWSALARGQSQDRNNRQGRTAPIDYTNLVYRNTVEELALAATYSKEDLNLRLSVPTWRK